MVGLPCIAAGLGGFLPLSITSLACKFGTALARWHLLDYISDCKQTMHAGKCCHPAGGAAHALQARCSIGDRLDTGSPCALTHYAAAQEVRSRLRLLPHHVTVP